MKKNQKNKTSFIGNIYKVGKHLATLTKENKNKNEKYKFQNSGIKKCYHW